ncbi:Gfo/Idh/MocA family protein [Vibrio amylolyticus]|uniref:Gfo/Idh/MocA family protein n=1 Tax=Vibrio amylolyticus TaxID=2847292 RepID=UPI0035519F69
MKIGVIGLGDIALKAYLPILANLSGIELVLCTRNKDVLKEVASKYRIKECCQDFKALPAMNVDAVMIHAATSVHFDIARYFLKQGIPTFVDKPLCDTAKQVEQLYEVATQQSTPLYVGFNRRHIPLYNQHIPELKLNELGSLTSLRWEKHRHNLPGELRTFIFDDFIHPLDSINLNSQSSIIDLHITHQRSTRGDGLSRLDVEWQVNGTLLQASMNRSFGQTCERIWACYENKAIEFDSFVQGQLSENNHRSAVALKDWTPMLKSKGFEDMLLDWFNVVECGYVDADIIERNIATHQLAENIYDHVASQIGA